MVRNPFSITKANDLSDEQIRDYWVDLAPGGGFESLISPRELMPKLFLGGKGSGKTHIFRYFSFPLQCVRTDSKAILDKVMEDGYLGIYVRCRGLDASRFSGKAQDREKWTYLFSYYMDLWLAYHVLGILQKLTDEGGLDFSGVSTEFSTNVLALFESDESRPLKTVGDLREFIRALQKQVDYSVNKAAITGQLDEEIRVSPGRLVFGIPKILASFVPELDQITFLYLIDELENIEAGQQQYINTLIRERQGYVTFRLGVRTYGMRTYKTLAADEKIISGSEYDPVYLDEHLRIAKKEYRKFSRDLVVSRLRQAGFVDRSKNKSVDVDGFFTVECGDSQGGFDTTFVRAKEGEREYFRKLRERLEIGLSRNISPGLSSPSDVHTVIDRLRLPDDPILEKINILLLYRAWNCKSNLIDSSGQIAKACARYREYGKEKTSYSYAVQHFSSDMYAQVCREYHRRFHYRGLATFINLSDGIPRNLLILLKTIYKWAVFAGEDPFGSLPISTRSQDRGVLETTDWFFRDAPVGGGRAAHNARTVVSRLGELFRALLYADKPPECSLNTFSASTTDLSVEKIVEVATDFSLLVKIPRGQKNKNTRGVDNKYQLNKMLVPRWGLPLARRGAISLSGKEVRIVFDPSAEEEFNTIKKIRVARANFPFRFAKKESKFSTPSLFDD